MNRSLLFLCLVLSAGCAAREPIVGGGEGCEAVFEGLPASLAATAQLAPPGETGERMLLEGVVRDAQGAPVAGVIVYAYHTDHRGEYPSDTRFPRGSWARQHGLLRGWVKTGPDGRYAFDTIRPAGYPDAVTPQHVHLHILEPGRCTYYIDDVVFEDDPRLNERHRRSLITGRGGNGLSRPVREADGRWRATRDIVLGARVPGYPPRS
jgi:protocatechuate 3,4-dioxygenase beta subunit